jgi:TP901 family phage tail tape measure protein
MTNVGADFEQQITNAAAKFPGEIRRGTEAFTQLENKAREVGATTEFSASQAAGAIDFLAMAGFDAQQSIGALPRIVDLATAANLDLATASDIASDALGQFNMTSEDSEQQTRNLARIMDVMVKTATTANTTVDGLFETYKQAAPVATAAGQSIETLNALTGTLANSGIKASQAGTTLRAVFGRLQAPTGEAAKVIDRLGIQTRDSAGDMLDVIDVLGQMGAKLDGFGTSQRAEILKKVFGEEPIAGVNILLAAGAKELDAYRKQLEGAAGSSSKLASIIRDTTSADLKGMSSALEGVTLTLFDFNKVAIREGIQGVTGWLRTVNDALQGNRALGESLGKDVFNAVVSLAKVIGILITATVALKVASIATSTALVALKVATVTLKIATVALTPVIWLLSAAFKALRIAAIATTVATVAWAAIMSAAAPVLATLRAAVLAFNIVLAANPIGAVVVAVGTLVAAAGLLIANWDSVADFFVGIWDSVGSAFSTAVDSIMTVVSPFLEVAGSVQSIWEKLTGVFDEPLKPTVEPIQAPEVPGSVIPVNFEQPSSIQAPEVPGSVIPVNFEQPSSIQAPGVDPGVNVISPQEDIVRSISERRDTAEITLRNETGSTAEVSKRSGVADIKIINSGGF